MRTNGDDNQTPFERIVAHLLSFAGLALGAALILASVLAHALQNRHADHEVAIWPEVMALTFGEIGAVMLAFALLHITYDRYTRRIWMKGIDKAVRDEGTFSIVGMKSARAELSNTDVTELLRNASRLRILKTWFPETIDMAHDLEEAISRQASIEILLCKPESSILQERSEGAGESRKEGGAWVTRTLGIFSKVCARSGSASFQIGLYDAWPGCPVIWADDTILLGFYFRERASPSAPWIEIWPGSRLATIIQEQFDSLWRHPKTEIITTCEQLAEAMKDRSG